ncbi:MAG: DUF4194 domain-containing protein [Verrucomicrobiales bacterium]
MPLPWPSFWQHIRTDDRAAVSEVLTALLAHGSILGDVGRDRQLYLLGREYQRDLAEYLAPLHLELVADPDRPILQIRPVPGDCGLLHRFSKAETLLILTLWRIYDDARLERPVETVVVTANDVWHKLKLYFEKVEPPSEAQLRDMLGKFRNRRLVRLQWNEESAAFGESQVEILPTLARVIPFEDAKAWEQQASLYQQPLAVNPNEETEEKL